MILFVAVDTEQTRVYMFTVRVQSDRVQSDQSGPLIAVETAELDKTLLANVANYRFYRPQESFSLSVIHQSVETDIPELLKHLVPVEETITFTSDGKTFVARNGYPKEEK